MNSRNISKKQLKSLLSKGLALLCLYMFQFGMLEAQDNVGIGTTSPDNSALLDLTATDMGMLVPRMTETQRDAIGSPATGLLIYQTDGTAGFYYYSGAAWVAVISSASGAVSGSGAAGQVSYWADATTITGSNDIFWNTAGTRLGLGNNSPVVRLDIVDGSGNGAIRVGNTSETQTGSIRWNGSDFQGYTGSAWESFLSSGGTGNLNGVNGSNGRIAFWNSSSTISGDDDLYWDNSNKVLSLGSTSPATTVRFYVEGDAQVNGNIGPVSVGFQPQGSAPSAVEGKIYYDDTQNKLQLYDGSSWTDIGGGGTPVGNSGNVQYNDGGSFGGTDNLHWDNANTRLGIGTASPVERLDLRDGSGWGGIRVANSTNANPGTIRWTGTDFEGYNNSAWVSLTSGSGGGTGGGGDVWGTDGSNGRIAFFNSSTTITGDDNFYWDNTNKVLGVGTNAPNSAAEIEVRNDKNTITNIYVNNANAGTGNLSSGAGVQFMENATANAGIWYDNFDDSYNLAAISGSPEFRIMLGGNDYASDTKLYISDAGRVGIGTVSPSSTVTLDVNGNTRIAGDLEVTGEVDPVSVIFVPQGSAPTAQRGKLYYNASGNQLQVYNGSSWESLGGAPAPAGNDSEIQFNNAGSLGASSNFVWDNSNVRLGIATGSPTDALDVNGGIVFGSTSNPRGSLTSTATTVYVQQAGGTSLQLLNAYAIISAPLIGPRFDYAGALAIGTVNSTSVSIGHTNSDVLIHGESTEPGDGDLANSQWTLWLDEANDEFELKAKKSDGTVISQTVGSGTGGGGTGGDVWGTGGSNGRIAYWNSSSTITGVDDLYWDNANTRMGIGTGSSPQYTLDVNGTIRTGMDGTDGTIILYSEQGGTDYSLTLQPNASMTQNVTLTLPADDGDADQVLTTDGSGNLSWATAGGSGDITAVGSMTSGAVFADGTASGQWLGLGAGAGRIEFDDQATDEINFIGSNVGIGTSAPANLLDVNGTIRTGMDGTDGSIILYSEQGGTDYSVTLLPHATMTQNVTLTLPADDGDADQVLTTDGSGNLSWSSAGGGSGDITAVGSMTSGDAFASSAASGQWHGLGAGAGRIEYDDQTTDEVNIIDANVGIGTSTPEDKLDVEGAVLRQGWFMARRTSSDQNNNNNDNISIVWNNEIRKDTEYFTFTSGTSGIQLVAGWYRISYTVNLEDRINNRNEMKVFIDDGSSEVPGSASYCYLRNTIDGRYNSCASSFIAEFTSTTTITVECHTMQGGDDYDVMINSQITIERID